MTAIGINRTFLSCNVLESPNEELHRIPTLLPNMCSPGPQTTLMNDEKKGKMDEKLTSYCGLCCADCMPSCEELFAPVDRLDQMLEQLQFDLYAELKSAQHVEF